MKGGEKKMTEVKVKVSEEKAREFEEKLFQRELVRARKRLQTTEASLKIAKMRVQYWKGRCNNK